jgi:hypothetical protein
MTGKTLQEIIATIAAACSPLLGAWITAQVL